MLEGLVSGIVMAGVGLIIAAMRRGSSAIGSRPRRLQSFTTAGSPQETLKAIILFGQQAGYRISTMDEGKGQLVLEEPASATSWGFFLPVFVSRQSDNSTLVEVGIKSKLVQFGPIVSRSHERCVNGIKTALFPQSGEVKKERKMSGASYFCNTCNNFTDIALKKGNGWIEFILYFFYIIPGIIYSIWRRSRQPNVCPICGAPTLVPAAAAKPRASANQVEYRDERECPQCAEKILVKAKVCKHCGKTI